MFRLSRLGRPFVRTISKFASNFLDWVDRISWKILFVRTISRFASTFSTGLTETLEKFWLTLFRYVSTFLTGRPTFVKKKLFVRPRTDMVWRFQSKKDKFRPLPIVSFCNCSKKCLPRAKKRRGRDIVRKMRYSLIRLVSVWWGRNSAECGQMGQIRFWLGLLQFCNPTLVHMQTSIFSSLFFYAVQKLLTVCFSKWIKILDLIDWSY